MYRAASSTRCSTSSVWRAKADPARISSPEILPMKPRRFVPLLSGPANPARALEATRASVAHNGSIYLPIAGAFVLLPQLGTMLLGPQMPATTDAMMKVLTTAPGPLLLSLLVPAFIGLIADLTIRTPGHRRRRWPRHHAARRAAAGAARLAAAAAGVRDAVHCRDGAGADSYAARHDRGDPAGDARLPGWC